MQNPTIRLWTDLSPPPDILQEIRRIAPSVHILRAPVERRPFQAREQADPQLAEADLAFGLPSPKDIAASPTLKWVQLSSAGYGSYDNEETLGALRRRGARLTNASHSYDEPVAQHALAMILAGARCLNRSAMFQRAEDWHMEKIRECSRMIDGNTSVLILGYGSIGRRLAALLKPFDARVLGFRRKPRGDEGIPMIAPGGLPDALASADHVVNILPDNPGSRGFFNAERFAGFKAGATFYNLGRGTTVDQGALIDALNSEHLGAAYLDVTDPEPLPSGHPLWTAPRCWITPHSAGGCDIELERICAHFCRNLKRFLAGDPLIDVIV